MLPGATAAPMAAECAFIVAVSGPVRHWAHGLAARSARDLDIPTAIVSAPTGARGGRARGLVTQCAAASALFRALEAAGFDRVDYLERRDAATLAPAGRLEASARARRGAVRLIDNVLIAPG